MLHLFLATWKKAFPCPNLYNEIIVKIDLVIVILYSGTHKGSHQTYDQFASYNYRLIVNI